MYLLSRSNIEIMKNMPYKICLFFFLLIYSCDSTSNKADNLNIEASFPDSFQYSPAGLKVISTHINKQVGTMSTLYGNPLALQKAIDFNEEVVAGEIFILVNWKQQPDAHWFGANIPGDLQSVEVIETILNSDKVVINYKLYEGKNLVLNTTTPHQSERIRFIMDQKPSIMP